MPNRRGWKYHVAGVLLAFICIAIFCVMIIGLMTAVRADGKGLGSSDAAGWMQAIGAFVAVGAAILVFYLQNMVTERQAAKHEAEELKGLLQSLRSELDVVSANAHMLVGEQIIVTSPFSGVFLYYPVPERPFEVYYGLIPKLGAVRDDALRARIVEVYAMAASFVATIRYNNDAIRAWENADLRHRRSSTTADLEAARRAHAAVVQYGDGVRFTYERAYTGARELVDRLSHC
jgi:hypothetical protein